MLGNVYWRQFLASSVSEFSPDSIAGLESWAKGDDATVDGLVMTSMSDAGSIGGSYDCPTDQNACAVTIDGKTAPAFRGTRSAQSTATAADFARLSNGTEDCTLFVTFRDYGIDGSGRVLCTYDGNSASNAGLLIHQSGSSLRALWSNGASATNSEASTVTLLGGGELLNLRIRKNGANVAFAVNDETEKTGVIPTPGTTPQLPLLLGNTANLTAPCNGLICEVLMYDSELTLEQCAQVETYLSDRWGAAPDYHPILLGDVALWRRADMGITLNSGNVSAWADQSGMGNDSIQAGAGSQPLFVASGQNGKPELQGATGDYLRCSNFTQGDVVQPSYVLTAGSLVSNANTEYMYDSANISKRSLLQKEGSDKLLSNSGVALSTASGVPAGPFLASQLDNGASSHIRIEPDGAVVQSATGDAGSQNMDGVTDFAYAGTASNYWTGTMGEILIFEGDIGTSARDTAIGEMSSYWDINNAPIISMAGDDAGAVTSGGFYDSVPSGGFVGGSFTSASTERPAVGTVDGKDAPVFDANDELKSGIAKAATNCLHNSDESSTLSILLRPDSLAAAVGVFANTMPGGGTDTGISHRVTTAGEITLQFGNGASLTSLTSSGAGITTSVFYMLDIVKTAGDVKAYLDGVEIISGSISSPSDSDSNVSLILGYDASTFGIVGAMPEIRMWQRALSANERATQGAEMRAYWGQ